MTKKTCNWGRNAIVSLNSKMLLCKLANSQYHLTVELNLDIPPTEPDFHYMAYSFPTLTKKFEALKANQAKLATVSLF